MAAYSHIYIHIQNLGAQEVYKSSSQRIYTQEASAHYNKLI